jgi:hypothetical protein
MQDAQMEARVQSAAEGIVELQRILGTSAADSAAAAQSEEWVFDHKLLEASVTVRCPHVYLPCVSVATMPVKFIVKRRTLSQGIEAIVH